MKEYKKMFVINGINISEVEFDSVLGTFNELELMPDRIEPDPCNPIVQNSTIQVVDKFNVEITTYYFNYFGKFIEIGQKIVSFKI